ncbi:DUF2786 domain-containing protein [Silvanigrella aquatica]|uniref:DUF2786 domain-containing protein n=1 Tax=Silvanigrella aquatica TaxID=1915309 RepID=A0A1L4D0Z4_9BACT|nr:DUF2786 domain-containing protein [Silvanigrella aquatica]APJ03858.1 hypothetical protein AXG55_08040 [Silvanigrella aquatica]
MNFKTFLNDLHSRMIVQLYKEFENICFQHRVNLKKPLIIIEQLNSTWGNWDPLGRVITLSAQLVEEYSWDIIIGVLKHEMAHQIVTEVFNSEDIHGKSFQKACELIGVPKEYCKASLNIENKITHWKNSTLGEEELVVMRKLDKLLNLAQSANEHEALLAMEKVQELNLKYNLNRIQEGLDSSFYSLIINFKKKCVPTTYVYISSLIQAHYFVNIIYSELYDPLCDESHKIIEIIGTRHNVLMAEYVFYFLKETIESLWKIYQMNNNLPARYKLSYQKGVLVGFQNKLDSIAKNKLYNEINFYSQKHNNSMSEIIILENKKLNEYTKRIYPRLSRQGASNNKVYSEYYADGKSDGKKIVINKPVSETKNQIYYLGIGK